jgi:anti-sigma-K factor RskA
MASHDAFIESAAGYAVGALHPDERRTFEAHLASCPRCQSELRELRRVAMGLALAAEPVAPPASLRTRVISYATSHPQTAAAAASAGAAHDPGRSSMSDKKSTTGVLDRPRTKQPLPSWVGIAIAASIGVALLAAVYAWALSAQVGSLREMVATASAESDRLRDELLIERQDAVRLVQTITIVTAPDARRVNLKGVDEFSGASGHAFWSPTQGLVFNADKLPALTPDRVYQLWVVQGTTVASAGILEARANGSATITTPLPPNITRVDQLAVSLEPAPGVPSRTGPVVLAGQ